MEDTATTVARLRAMVAGLRGGYQDVRHHVDADLVERAADLIEGAWGCAVLTSGEDRNGE